MQKKNAERTGMQQGGTGQGRRKSVFGVAWAALCLGVMAASLPGQGLASVGTSNFVATTTLDAFSQPFVIAEIPDRGYAGMISCSAAYNAGTLDQTPYIVVFPGDTGNFGNISPANSARNDYYSGVLTREAITLSNNGPCVRVVAVETRTADSPGGGTPSYTGYATYPYYGFGGANMSGSQEVSLPISNGATAEFAITLAIQRNPKYSRAPRWYLHGGSAGALRAARLIDMLNGSVVWTWGYKIPEATLLESLPVSGDMYKVCQNISRGSTVYGVIDREYRVADRCASVVANPGPYNYKVLGSNMRDWYLNTWGKRIYVMAGADDLIWKGVASNPGWTALGNYKNFLATIGTNMAACSYSAYAFEPAFETRIYNADAWADCEGGRLRIKQYQYGGHGPLANSAVGYHPYGTAESFLRQTVQ